MNHRTDDFRLSSGNIYPETDIYRGGENTLDEHQESKKSKVTGAVLATMTFDVSPGSELLNSLPKVFPGGLVHEIARLINLSSGSE